MLHAANALNNLKSPPGNRLEKLAGDRVGQYSIRINDRWRKRNQKDLQSVPEGSFLMREKG